MPRVRIIKKNDEYSSEYDLGDNLKSQEPGTAAYTLRENPGFRFLWTRMNIWNWTQNHRSKKIRQ